MYHHVKKGTDGKAGVKRYFLHVGSAEVLMFVGEYGTWLGRPDGLFGQRKSQRTLVGGTGDLLEVLEIDLPYLKKPEGEWEFRKVVVSEDEVFWGVHPDGCVYDCNIITGANVTFLKMIQRDLSGYRWCRPAKVDAFETWWDKNGVSTCYKAFEGKDIARKAWKAGRVDMARGK
jgi:hypothetical protein